MEEEARKIGHFARGYEVECRFESFNYQEIPKKYSRFCLNFIRRCNIISEETNNKFCRKDSSRMLEDISDSFN